MAPVNQPDRDPSSKRSRAGSSPAGCAIPLGYVLVPEEATIEMIEAGIAATAAWLDLSHLRGIEVQREKYRRRWRAMVKAAVRESQPR